jgi:putative restriction endonuclease
MSKYSALRRVEGEAGPSVEMTFGEIDSVVGGLPASARRHSAWWSNEREGTHVQARPWMDAGWHVGNVHLNAERVRFVKS